MGIELVDIAAWQPGRRYAQRILSMLQAVMRFAAGCIFPGALMSGGRCPSRVFLVRFIRKRFAFVGSAVQKVKDLFRLPAIDGPGCSA